MGAGSAILVGLKSVDPAAYGGWSGKGGCWGAELDVDNIEMILYPLGYTVQSFKTAQATRSNILAAVTAAASALKAKDTLVFYFSGHGGQQPDADGDEFDGQDETMLAYDHVLVDDDLSEVWTGFRRGVRIIMISDSCNSGKNYRNLRTVSTSTPLRALRTATARRMKAQMIHLAGCRDGQMSAGGVNGGAFTSALCAAWNDGFSGGYRDFLQAVAAAVQTGQTPEYSEFGPVTARFRAQRPFSLYERSVPRTSTAATSNRQVVFRRP